MKWKHLLIRLALIAGVIALTTSESYAQSLSTTDASLASSAQISTDSGGVFNLTTHSDRFALVGLLPGQVVIITLNFATSMAGQTISATAMDGGTLVANNQGQIASNGTLSLRYQAANSVGAYRIFLARGDAGQTLHFWVRDVAKPQNNPPVFPGS